jgi:opacity protein-like surface antigen
LDTFSWVGDTATGVTAEEGSARHRGWYIGGGDDMALAQNWTIGLEYRHYEFDDKVVTFHTPAGVLVVSQRILDVLMDFRIGRAVLAQYAPGSRARLRREER